jgi:hypothetical protein
MAPEGFDKLSPKERSDAAKLITVLTGDPTGVTALPSLIAKANNGDPLALVQVLTFFAKFRTGNAIDDLLKGGKSPAGIPNDWRPINGAGAQVNTPAGFTSYITPDGDIVHVSPAGLVYGSDKNFVNRVDHVLAHTQPDPTKPTHTVFNVQGDQALALVDEAWLKRGAPAPNDAKAFVVDMGRPVGTNGETRIRLVVDPATKEITTAYPY